MGIFNKKIVANAMALASVSLSALVAADYSQHSEINSFIAEMTSEHQFVEEDLRQLFTQVEKKQSILDAIARPAEKTLTWGEYRDIFIEERRINNGVKFWQKHAGTLARAEQELGVAPQVVVAILGVETRYGTYTGNYRVIDALSTLGFDYPPRSKFFRKELVNFMLLSREQQQNPLELTGSYAGAMGYGQFMPSSYRAYAVDFDADGFTDIWNNPVDAIGSVANYFKRHGWRAGQPVASRVKVSANFDQSVLTKKLSLTHSVTELESLGYTAVNPVDGELDALVMKHQGEAGTEFWMGFKNFEVITRYNRSQLYALAVYQLSEELRKRYDSASSSALTLDLTATQEMAK
ncbi:lytic murein transglycosylase B [Aurantivibrio plasticivorans]